MEDKNIKLKKNSNGKILIEFILFIIIILSIFLMISLISFYPYDPSWSQTTWRNEPIKNLAGSVGAWLADILFSIFGVLAYFLPLIIFFGFWNIFKDINNDNYFNFFLLSLNLIGEVMLIITSCAIATLNIDDLVNFSSGGIIGSIFSNAILPRFGILGTTFILIFIWFIGFTLFTGLSWLMISEKIGELVLAKLSLIINYIINNNKFQIRKFIFNLIKLKNN
ncbi:MAG: DNA translocase FtsK 4TM domain-containing protein [Arsenophonus sp.]